MEDDHYIPDVIIACGRGGLILAPIISRNLNSKAIQIINFDYHYEWENKQRNMFFEKRHLPIKEKKVLICAGQVNSGQSLIELSKEIKTFCPKEIKTACIFNNKARIISIDYVGKYQKIDRIPPWLFRRSSSQ
jgi:hypoxanthine phosphoribosyltransferase